MKSETVSWSGGQKQIFTYEKSVKPGQIIECDKPSDFQFGFATVIHSIYVIGSLANSEIPKFANELQTQGFEAFADWYSPGPDADNYWRDYSKARGLTYKQALQSHGARMIFEFDKSHLDRCDAAVMLMPAGKSGHLELGYTIGRGKPGYILFDGEPERYDVMTQFATGIFFSKEELFEELKKYRG
jgi:hypothetical protein